MAESTRIAKIEKHKVKSGESIDSLAKGAGLNWKDLARFNWGTDVPTEINQYLRDVVGCTKKTKDGYNYMFSDSDDPGIVFIPRQWSLQGLATDQTHTIRVSRESFLDVYVLHFEDADYLLPNSDYIVLDDQGNVVTSGKSDKRARIQLPSDFVPGWQVLAGKLHKVKGTVLLPGSREPLRKETVEVTFWTRASTTADTDDNGKVSLENVPEGSMAIRWQGHQAVLFIDRAMTDATFLLKEPDTEGEEKEIPDDHDHLSDLRQTGSLLNIRLAMDPADPNTEDDTFTLHSEPKGKYEKTLTVFDDGTAGDQCVDLVFDEVDPKLNYSLAIDTGGEGKKFYLFENIPYSELGKLGK